VKNVLQRAEERDGEPRIVDNINLPEPLLNPPVDKTHWRKFQKVNLLNQAVARLAELKGRNGLLERDLVTAMYLLRVQPLQRRPHLMCYLCGPLDACRGSSNEISRARVNRKYREVTQDVHLPSAWGQTGWEWGMEPYTLSNPPPLVSNLFLGVSAFVFSSLFSC
jgi:hypothetical protein